MQIGIRQIKYIKGFAILLIVLAGWPMAGKAQLYINDTLQTAPGSLIWIDNDVIYGADNKTQLINHNGLLLFTKNWYNMALSNDAKVFTNESQGEIQMIGGVQTFNGNLATRFPILTLTGSDKKVQEENIEINIGLNLLRELDVNGYTANVITNDVNAVYYTDAGFVNTSSKGNSATGGWFIRKVASVDHEDYLFPMGNQASTGTYRFRPLKINSKNAGNIYVQFQQYNPGNDNYPTTSVIDVAGVNSLWYHNLKTDDANGNTLTVSDPYSTANDGSSYNTMAEWNLSQAKWQALTVSTGPAMSGYNTTDNLFTGEVSLAGTQMSSINLAIKQDDNDVTVPNIITPNGDGINDYLVIKGLDKYGDNELLIFNRWNNVVFESKNYTNNWQGTGLNEGTYFYALRAKDKVTGQWVLSKKGYVMIMR